MIIQEKTGEILVNVFGKVYNFKYDKVTTYEGFRFAFGKADDPTAPNIGDYCMIEMSCGICAIKKSDCTSVLKGRLAEAMCNKFLLKAHNHPLTMKQLVDAAWVKVEKYNEFELWKTSLIGLP